MPDVAVGIDADHDGHDAGADCNDGNPEVWRELFYSARDADGDRHTVASTGTICSGVSLPAGYLMQPLAPDCDDADPAAFTAVTGYLDLDGDGRGEGELLTFCNAGMLPAGHAAVGDDCAPADPARSANRSYRFRDADGDGAAVAEVGVVCSGAALPQGYLDVAPVDRPLDCNDADAEVAIALTVFADADRDGVGAGASQLACTSGTPPSGFALTGSDCDDGNAAVWLALLFTAVDFDEDGFTAPAIGMRCTAGTLTPPYFATPNGSDCDDADVTRWLLLAYLGIDEDNDGVTVPANDSLCTDGALPPPFRAVPSGNDCDDNDPGLTRFAVLYRDQDQDGVGAPPREVRCLGPADPAGLVPGGYDEDDSDPAVIETEDFNDLLDLVL